MPDTFKELIDERNKALCELDMDYARQLMPLASNDFVRLIGMHKARYECTDIPRELRHESGNWLRERNLKAFKGKELMAEGILPE